LANFNRKEHVRHRAVSLRQHGSPVLQSGAVLAAFSRPYYVVRQRLCDRLAVLIAIYRRLYGM